MKSKVEVIGFDADDTLWVNENYYRDTEKAYSLSNGKVSSEQIQRIIGFGKDMLEKPIELLPGVNKVLERLNGSYTLIVATKGDLLDQERKLSRSSLSSHFHHIDIMSDKKEMNYRKLMEDSNSRFRKLGSMNWTLEG